MLIVLDTNMFRGDVHAERPWLRSILDGAQHGDFEVVVPEAVVQELIKQFPLRLQEAVDGVRATVGKASKALTPFGIAAPPAVEVDQEALITGYEARLRGRLSGQGARIEPHPSDLKEAVEWAVQRRKPFKESGEGLPDASIWQTTLNLAAEAGQVLLATTNKEDFGDGEEPPSLAPELVSDLIKRRLPPNRVRLIVDLKVLVEEIVEPMAESETRAQRILSDPDLSTAMKAQIIDSMAYTEIPQGNLGLGIELDNDPQVFGLDVEKLELLSAREASDSDHLFLEIRALVDLTLSMAVFKPDYYGAEEDSPVTISGDLNDHYFDGEADASVWMTIMAHTDLAVEDVDLELADVEEASAEDVIAARLENGAADALIEQLPAALNPGSNAVSAYRPDLELESDIDEANIDEISPERVELVSVDEYVSSGVACTLRVEASADISWLISAPTGIDATRHADLAEGDTESAPWLSRVAEGEPVVLTVTAVLSPSDKWLEVAVEEARLSAAELERRPSGKRPKNTG